MSEEKVLIRFIGRKPPFIDDMYGTGLSFDSGQERSVPAYIAKQLLRHGDLFEQVEESAVEEPASEEKPKGKKPKGKNSKDDDTDVLLEKAAKEKAQEQEEYHMIEDIRLRVMTTENKEELSEMAMLNWRQELDKSLPIEDMRAAVIQYIDQFGIV